MTVTHTLGDIGTFTVGFSPSTPGAILDIGDYPLLMVLPARIPAAQASMITRPLFRGPILARDGLYGLTGADMAWYLGTTSDDLTQTDGFGPWFASLWSAATPATVMATITAKNGLSYAIEAGIGGTITGGVNGTARTALDRTVCPQLQCEWRVYTDGTVALYRRSTALSSRAVIFTADPGGTDPGVLSWRISDRTPNISNADRRNRQVLRWTDNTGATQTSSTTLATGPKAYGGANLEVAEFGSSSATTSGDVASERDFLAAVHNLRTQALTVHTDTPMAVTQLPSLDLFVGAGVGIFDPDIGMYDTSMSPVMFRGRPIWPATVRVTQVEWPITAGMGVYLDSRWAGGALVDVTDWVVWDADPTTGAASDTVVTVGQLPRWWDGKRRTV